MGLGLGRGEDDRPSGLEDSLSSLFPNTIEPEDKEGPACNFKATKHAKAAVPVH